VTLQRGAKVIRPDRHLEFSGKIVEKFGGGDTAALCGINLHFLHVPGKGPNPCPLLLLHG
jgi:hypothetical protein